MNKRSLLNTLLVFVFAGAVGSAGCESGTTLPESTTTLATPNADTTAKSADGKLRLLIPAGALDAPTRIVITTRRDLFFTEAVRSAIYELGPIDLMFHSPAELQIDLPDDASEGELEIMPANLESDEQSPSAGEYHAGSPAYLSTPLSKIAGPLYMLWDAAVHQSPCPTEQPLCDGSWDDPPGSGVAWVIDQLSIGDDGQLRGLSQFAGAAIDRSLESGEVLNILEVGSLGINYAGVHNYSTLKIYGALDADDPARSDNNFRVPPGGATCCEFSLSALSLDGAPPQARARFGLMIQDGHGSSSTEGELHLLLHPNLVLPIHTGTIALDFTADEREISSGTISGAIPLGALAAMEVPYCASPAHPCEHAGGSMLDFVSFHAFAVVDTDLDGDGLETLLDSDDEAGVDTCLDGCLGSGCVPEVVPDFVVDGVTVSCVFSPRMADGFSISLDLHAVGAKIVSLSSAVSERAVDLYPLGTWVYGRIDAAAFGGPISRLNIASTGGANTSAISQEDGTFAVKFAGAAGDSVTFTAVDSSGAEDRIGAAITVTVPAPTPVGEQIEALPSDALTFERTYLDRLVVACRDCDVPRGAFITVSNIMHPTIATSVSWERGFSVVLDADAGDVLEVVVTQLDGMERQALSLEAP